MPLTNGPWRYDAERNAIVSTTEWLIPPDPADDEEGVSISVISTYSAMGGDDSAADARCLAGSWDMVQALRFYARWGVHSPATDDEIREDGGEKARALLAALNLE